MVTIFFLLSVPIGVILVVVLPKIQGKFAKIAFIIAMVLIVLPVLTWLLFVIIMTSSGH